jgi:hypothetical protein
MVNECASHFSTSISRGGCSSLIALEIVCVCNNLKN